MEREEPAKNTGKSRRAPYPFVPMPVPVFVPFSPKVFDEFLERIWPSEYYDSLVHLRNARIELLKAVNSAVSKRIEILEKQQKESRPQKEKVKVT
ncbi:MAG: hypothetical protein QXX17_04165 [Conexivisphaerales archaeon]